MTGTAARHLYLARHGEASPDESTLTAAGRRQAVLLGQRLRHAHLTAIHHGPLPRAEQTARLIHEQLDGAPALQASEPAGDYIPYLPQREELPPESADATLDRLALFPAEERERGPELARTALTRFTGPVDGDEPRHELVVTHNFLIGWLVRAALDAPKWRWMGLNHANAALTVIRYAPDRPASVLFYNDMGHLPDALRWTGFPPELRV
ncbi:putative phosphoglycerate mutase [Streptomyces lincolnensis]|uniref:Putative phosphoglycerate mutase n=1 Tax=Streptomyces lincolnensis TaxID=1915 RepID=A0A1B1M253_STRLN|nr:histidine phosphatase family protein [Streptomyces lincolnensis]ANS62503.1 putative phosphoglycerate mutase [Streptomyces lincolnensis]AXG51428.1 putative phosphoglycerate mutase [Streptomyces lincolnensis]QMV04488.1 histidine phosphatase family protein [Streptomyces lincolnensis]QMV11836.1 histidine phosphatase family protein [Streptomyces lincolnensis]